MSLTKRILLYAMGAMYVAAGVAHLQMPDAYLKMMPPYLPWHLELIYLSGIAEIVCGVGVMIPSTRKRAAWATIALLIAIFPANVHVALYDVPLFGARDGAGLLNWVRLPFQLVLIGWAFWYTRGD